MRMLNVSLAALAATALTAVAASAAPVTYDVTFSASGFTAFPGGSAPTDPVTGEFTITLDTTQTYSTPTTGTTAGITLNNLNINLGSPLSFSYSPTGTSSGRTLCRRPVRRPGRHPVRSGHR